MVIFAFLLCQAAAAMGAAEAKWGETIAEAKAATDAAVEEVQHRVESTVVSEP